MRKFSWRSLSLAPEAKAIAVLIGYELKKTLAKKRVLIIIALIFLLEVSIYLVSTLLPQSLVRPFIPIAWTVGLLAPAGLLLHILALTVGSASFSEEYEMGTADYWLTRPISMAEYFIGKALGSLTFITIIIGFYSALSLLLPWYIYGPQTRLDVFALAVLVSVASTGPFLSLGISMGELLRRSMLATITSASAFFASIIIETYITLVGLINNDPTIIELTRYLPTWPATRLVSTALADVLPTGIPVPGPTPFTGAIPGQEIWAALANLAIYTTLFLMIALVRLTRTDVTRRAT